MPETEICRQCGKLLREASDAMRHHDALTEEAIHLVARREPTEKERQDFRTRITATFHDAQSAWDVYRDHMKTVHGYPLSRRN